MKLTPQTRFHFEINFGRKTILRIFLLCQTIFEWNIYYYDYYYMIVHSKGDKQYNLYEILGCKHKIKRNPEKISKDLYSFRLTLSLGFQLVQFWKYNFNCFVGGYINVRYSKIRADYCLVTLIFTNFSCNNGTFNFSNITHLFSINFSFTSFEFFNISILKFCSLRLF